MSKRIGLILVLLFIMATLGLGALGCARQSEVNMPVVLLTDFGNEDYRVPQLKGIIYSNNAEARLIDASHDVPAFDIVTGAFILEAAAKEFPENVVFIAIVAPYAQPVIRYLVLTTGKHQIFILPDNGLLTYVVKGMGTESVYEITDSSLFDRPMEELVAERIQGKVGALIASGYASSNVGSPLTSFTTLDIQEPAIVDNRLLGTIVYIDHYGNAVTNVPKEIVNGIGVQPGDTVQVKLLGDTIPVKFGIIYSDVPQGEEIMFVSNNLEVVQLCINLGNFAGYYGVKAGTKIEIEKWISPN
jgi:S-adenosyl-L-methionine hydrolase (adenosine-forming)